MTTRFVAVEAAATVSDVLAKAAAMQGIEGLHYVYIVDEAGRLTGAASAKTLVSAPRDAVVSAVKDRGAEAVRAGDATAQVISTARRHRIEEVPVVDEGGRLVGIITYDDILGAANERAGEEVLRVAGMDGAHPARAPFARQLVQRLPWLTAALVGELALVFVMRYYADMIKDLVAIVFFVPVVMAVAGIAGVQSATMTAVGLASGEVDYSRLARVLLREVAVGAALSVFLGLATGFFVHFFFQAEGYATGLAITTAVGVAAGMMASICAGTLLPIACSKMGIDSGAAAGPLVRVLADIASVAIYFAVAAFVLTRSL
jgi:magnesium transporter